MSERLGIVIVGHVDHGKSTLVGRLLHDTGSLPEGKLEQLRQAAERRGAPFEWANLMDALQSERDQNVTIDTAQTWFRTARRSYALIDAPGHAEFLRNLLTGAAHADAALLLIDASEGVREDSRRHGYLLSLLGIRDVAVLVNKMDLAGFREGRFREIETEYRGWLETVGMAPRAFIPIAARHGDNVALRSAGMDWYGGPTVLEALDAFEPPAAPRDRPLRFPIQDVYRFDSRRILAGRVESGTLRVGDRLVFAPSERTSTVRSIERWSAAGRTDASEGECVGITLDPQIFVERGAVAARAGSLPHASNRVRGRICWLGEAPLRSGSRYKLRLATTEADCQLEEVESVIDPWTLAAVPSRPGRIVGQHEIADVIIRTRRPIAFDAFGSIAQTGRFVIVDGLDVAGAGIISGAPTRDAALDDIGSSAGSPGRKARPGRVLWLAGAPGSGKRRIAAELEQDIAALGGHAFVLDAEHAPSGLWSDLALSPRDRSEKIRRVHEAAKLLERAGVICIATVDVSRADERDRLRELVPGDRLVEVDVVERRNVTKAARAILGDLDIAELEDRGSLVVDAPGRSL